jgi:hypothetical protein
MWLAPGGALFAECSEQQAAALAEIYAGDGGGVDVAVDDESRTAIVMVTASR